MTLPADFWVPPSVGKPRTPKFVCRLCDAPFYEGEDKAYEKHVVDCSNEREQEIHERSLRRRLPFLDPANWDTEYEDWVRKTGRVR